MYVMSLGGETTSLTKARSITRMQAGHKMLQGHVQVDTCLQRR